MSDKPKSKATKKVAVSGAPKKPKYWCPDCRHYCSVDCCDHWTKDGERIL